jgi:hypothetical protein
VVAHLAGVEDTVAALQEEEALAKQCLLDGTQELVEVEEARQHLVGARQVEEAPHLEAMVVLLLVVVHQVDLVVHLPAVVRQEVEVLLARERRLAGTLVEQGGGKAEALQHQMVRVVGGKAEALHPQMVPVVGGKAEALHHQTVRVVGGKAEALHHQMVRAVGEIRLLLHRTGHLVGDSKIRFLHHQMTQAVGDHLEG